MICDFCSSPGPRWEYRCRPAVSVVGNCVVADFEPWAVCDECHRLIQAGNHDGLTKRTIDTLIENNPEFEPERAELYAFLRCGSHAQFHEGRIGPPVPLAPERMRAAS